MIRLSIKYIRFFKQQSLYVLFGIVAMVAVLTAVNNAFETNNAMELARARKLYGDYHFAYPRLTEEDISRAYDLMGECSIEKLGYLRRGKIYPDGENAIAMVLESVNEEYKEMMGMELLEGRYPANAGEIALEEWVLASFPEQKIGAQIALKENGHTDVYTLTGILKDRAGTKGDSQKAGYVSWNDVKDVKEGDFQLYIKYDETKNLRTLEGEFHEKFQCGREPVINRDVVCKIWYDATYKMDFSASAEQGGGAERGKTFREWLAGSGLDKIIGSILVTAFSMVILYSVFRISVEQRIRELGKLQAFGLGLGKVALLLGSELCILFLIGFPLGTLLGAAVIWGIYQLYNRTGTVAFTMTFLEQLRMEDIFRNAGLMLLILVVIVLLVVLRLSRMTVMETIKGQKREKKGGHAKKKKERQSRIWSQKTERMMPVVLLKYIKESRGRVVTMILMLSLGGTVFLTGNYLKEQTERNNHLTHISDNGTNADVRVSIDRISLSDWITDAQVEQIRKIPEVKRAEAVSFYYGAIPILEEQIRKEIREDDFSYWKNQDKGNSMIASAGGHLTEEEPGKYNLKTEIYGYDEEMLKELKDFIVEGSVDSVYQKDTIIWQALMNGVGDWDIVNLHAGDTITLRYPKKNPGWIYQDSDPQILGMVPEGAYKEAYEERTFTIGAVVKGSVANNEQFLLDDSPAVIMPNSVFRDYFDVGGYNIVSVQLKDQRTATETAKAIRSITKGTGGCSVIDYTPEILSAREFLSQTMLLVQVIVGLLLAIGFFNIISSVNYMLVQKKKDFAVMRALGITDVRLMQTIMGEGIAYGLTVSILMVLFTLLLQIPVKFFLDHGFVYLNATYGFSIPLALGVTALNVLLSMAAVIVPAKQVLFHEVTEELADIE